jgi:murein DD-endopeptidase MepM/ murein hydrolase activator NlpD
MSSTRRHATTSTIASALFAAVFAIAGCGTATTPPAGAEPSLLSAPFGSPGSPTPVDTPNANRAAPPPSRSPAASRSPVAGTPGVFVFPVIGHYSYAHVHHDYPATDILAPCGSQVVAATSGIILEVTRVDKWKRSVDAGATRGGLSVSIRGDDGVRYYGSHFEAINTNIKPGVRVRAGQPLGKVGETGDAGACHLHFGLSPVCAGTGDWWNQRGVIWPWRYLDSWRKGGDKSPVAEITSWQHQHGCPTKPTVDP